MRTSVRTKAGKVQVFGADAEFLLGANGEVATSVRALLSADVSLEDELASSVDSLEAQAEETSASLVRTAPAMRRHRLPASFLGRGGLMLT